MRSRAYLAVAVALCWLATSGSAWAAPRLSVGPVAGDRAAAIPAQLAGALCVRFECVLWREVSANGKVDAAKVRRAGVAGVLTGAVERRAGAAQARLALADGSPQPRRSWTFTLTPAGLLGGDDLEALERDLAATLAPPVARPPAPSAPVAATRPAAPAAPAVAPAAPVGAAPPPRVEPPPAPVAPPPTQPRPVPAPPARSAASPPRAAAGPAPAPAVAPGRWLAGAELGLFWAQRELSYGGLGTMTGTLHGFKASAVTGPRLLLEAYPLAHQPGSVLAGLGLAVDYARALGLKTEAPGGGKRDTSFSRLRLGLAWRSPPLASVGLVLVPSLSYRRYQVSVSPVIDGLPDADLAGLRPALDVEVPVGGRLTLLAGAGWTKWTSAGDLVSGTPAFFPGGSASALDLSAGVDAALWGPLSLRALLEYESTRYALDADPTGTYAASSATDRVLGARAVVRGTY